MSLLAEQHKMKGNQIQTKQRMSDHEPLLKRGHYLELWKATEECSFNHHQLEIRQQKHISFALVHKNLTKYYHGFEKNNKKFTEAFLQGNNRGPNCLVCLLLQQSQLNIRE